MRAYSRDGRALRFDATGGGEPTLVFVHGWCGDRDVWRHQRRSLADRYRVVALDLAGHGDSEGGRAEWTMRAFGEDVARVVDAATDGPVVLIGHSMGGEVIVEAARSLPGRVLGLLGVDCLWDPDREIDAGLIERTLAPFLTDYAAAADAYVRALFLPGTDPALVESLVRSMTAVPAEVGLGALEQILRHRPRLRDGLRRLEVPIAVIHSSDWRPMNLDAARAHGLEVISLPGVGHFSMLEAPEAVHRLIDDWLGRLLGGRFQGASP